MDEDRKSKDGQIDAPKTEDQPRQSKRSPRYSVPKGRIRDSTVPPDSRGPSKCRVSRVRGKVRSWCGQLVLTVIRIRTMGTGKQTIAAIRNEKLFSKCRVSGRERYNGFPRLVRTQSIPIHNQTAEFPN